MRAEQPQNCSVERRVGLYVFTFINCVCTHVWECVLHLSLCRSCGRPREEEGERGKTWVDNTDPISGSVFFVDSASLPRPLPNGSAIPPSNSSSSLSSSTTSLSHPHTLTSSPRPHRSSSFSTSLPPTPNDAFFSPTFPHPHRPPPPHRTHTPQSLYSSSALPSPTHSEEFDG